MAKTKKRFSAMNHRLKDPLGKAVQLYWQGLKVEKATGYTVLVKADLIEDDVIPVEYLFRTWDEMPGLEQLAITESKGRVLDVGAAAGCHSLELQSRGLDVLPIDTSHGAIEVMNDRGLSPKRVDFFGFQPESQKFDTILLLMNGLGLAGTEEGLPLFFERLTLLLADGGQVLLDSSDFYEDAEDFSEIEYTMTFLNYKTSKFKWLYLPYAALEKHASENGFTSELLLQELDGSYLARLVKSE